MFAPILIGLLVVVACFAIFISTRPGDFKVERAAAIAAPPSAVFAHVNDFHKWEAWSPWAKIDPALRTTYDGPPAGTGAVYHWAGNSKVGEGRMTILESRPGEFIRIKLEFIKPFAATNATEFNFKPDGHQTRVTWTMTGASNFITKAFCLFKNMDKMVGGDFEKGLAQLKAVAESAGRGG